MPLAASALELWAGFKPRASSGRQERGSKTPFRSGHRCRAGPEVNPGAVIGLAGTKVKRAAIALWGWAVVFESGRKRAPVITFWPSQSTELPTEA